MDELYDLQADPFELNNLIATDEGRRLLPDLRAELAAAARKWISRRLSRDIVSGNSMRDLPRNPHDHRSVDCRRAASYRAGGLRSSPGLRSAKSGM